MVIEYGQFSYYGKPLPHYHQFLRKGNSWTSACGIIIFNRDQFTRLSMKPLDCSLCPKCKKEWKQFAKGKR